MKKTMIFTDVWFVLKCCEVQWRSTYIRRYSLKVSEQTNRCFPRFQESCHEGEKYNIILTHTHTQKKRKHFSSASVRSKRTYLQNEILSREKKQTQISKQKKPHHKLSHRTRWHEGDYQRLDNWNILFSKMAQFPAVFFFLWNLSTKHKTCFWPLQTANAIKQNWRSDTSLSDFAFWFILEQLMWLFG